MGTVQVVLFREIILNFQIILKLYIILSIQIIINVRFWSNRGDFCPKFFTWQIYKHFNFDTTIAY
jgi:hypothetical protein